MRGYVLPIHVPIHARAAAAALAAACGGGEREAGAGPGAGSESESESEGEAAPGAATVRVGFELGPGEEDTRCADIAVGNDRTLAVHRIRSRLSPTSHHMVVYRTPSQHESPEPAPCPPFFGAFLGLDAPVFGAQSAEAEIELPDGVAYQFSPGQMVRVEIHAINYGDETARAETELTFEPLPGGSEPEQWADMVFYGTLAVEVPPGDATVGPFWLPVEEGVRLFALSGHTHRLGTNVKAARAMEQEEQAGAMVYDHDPWAWSEPPIDVFDPGLAFAPGEGLRIWCDYHNPTGETVGFGESAGDEMCFLFGYYYPARGPILCLHTDDSAGCCPAGELRGCGLL